jgi:hypothetical protein
MGFEFVAARDTGFEHVGVVESFPGLLLGYVELALALHVHEDLLNFEQFGHGIGQFFEFVEIMYRQHAIGVAVQQICACGQGRIAIKSQQGVEPQQVA